MLLKPKRLKRGDTIAAISPSSGLAALAPHRYQAGKRQIEETFGLKVVETPNALRESDWLYRNPKARAADLHWALENPNIQGIFATIGGDESVRILPTGYSPQMTETLYAEVRRVLAEFGREDMPVVANMDFGHTSPQMVVPIGCCAAIDPAAKRVAVLEAGVS